MKKHQEIVGPCLTTARKPQAQANLDRGQVAPGRKLLQNFQMISHRANNSMPQELDIPAKKHNLPLTQRRPPAGTDQKEDSRFQNLSYHPQTNGLFNASSSTTLNLLRQRQQSQQAALQFQVQTGSLTRENSGKVNLLGEDHSGFGLHEMTPMMTRRIMMQPQALSQSGHLGS